MLLQITSTAGGGTLTLEFGVLSRLTNNTGQYWQYESVLRFDLVVSLLIVSALYYSLLNLLLLLSQFLSKLPKIQYVGYGHAGRNSTLSVPI